MSDDNRDYVGKPGENMDLSEIFRRPVVLILIDEFEEGTTLADMRAVFEAILDKGQFDPK